MTLHNSYCEFGLPWELLHPQATPDMLGYVPGFVRADDPRSASEQINDRYGQYGGWKPNSRWKINAHSISYPGDPPRPLVASAMLRDELLQFYAGAYVAIIQSDGSFEVARID